LILKGKYKYVNPNLSDLAKDLIGSLLIVEPSWWIEIDDALKHPWLTNVSLSRIRSKIFLEGEKTKIDAELDYQENLRYSM